MEIKNGQEKLVAKDFITIAIVVVLHFVLFTLLTPLGMIPVGSIFIYAAGALMWGSLFVLLCSKVNKKGAVFAYGALIGLIQIMNFWITGAIIIAGALIAEILWNVMGRKKFTSMTVAFTVLVTSLLLGMAIPLIFLYEQSMSALSAYAELYQAVYELIKGPLLFVAFAATVVCSIAGMFIGKKLMKKHFEKAGIL